MKIWERFGVFFKTNDGSLPGVSIEPQDPSAVRTLYFEIRKRSQLQASPPSTLWDAVANADVPLATLADPIALIDEGRTSCFHHPVHDFVVGQTPLPAIGIFVSSRSMVIDYKMGEWTQAQVETFITWLADVAERFPNTLIELDEEVSDTWTASFRDAFSELQATRSSQHQR
jgi:hypothetical protein